MINQNHSKIRLILVSENLVQFIVNFKDAQMWLSFDVHGVKNRYVWNTFSTIIIIVPRLNSNKNCAI